MSRPQPALCAVAVLLSPVLFPYSAEESLPPADSAGTPAEVALAPVAIEPPIQSLSSKPPLSISLGKLLIRPAGFIEADGLYRTTASNDIVSTRFGALPLGESHSQTISSFRHSRTQVKAEFPINGTWKLSGYLESDFLNRNDPNPFRWRQYWGKVEAGGWEVLAGRGWSLLRPNRVGINTESELMNTRIADPGYHVGLLGNRDRHIRVVRHLNSWHIGVSYENGKDFVAKVVQDAKRVHWELIGVDGANRHRGLSAAAVVHATRRLDLVTQQFRSQGGGRDALNTMPLGVSLYSGIAGAEYRIHRRVQIYAYEGMVRGGRSQGNRTVTEESIGATIDIWRGESVGRTSFAFQYSDISRATWPGAKGRQELFIVSVRHTLGSQ